MPRLNESEFILELVLKKIKRVFVNTKYKYEILVADNGSTDTSRNK